MYVHVCHMYCIINFVNFRIIDCQVKIVKLFNPLYNTLYNYTVYMCNCACMNVTVHVLYMNLELSIVDLVKAKQYVTF